MRTVKEHVERAGTGVTCDRSAAETQSTAQGRLQKHVLKPLGIKKAPNVQHLVYSLTTRKEALELCGRKGGERKQQCR